MMRTAGLLALTLCCASPVLAQTPAEDDLQPGVNTSAMPAQPPAAPPSAAAMAPPASAPSAKATAAKAPPAGASTAATAAGGKGAKTGKSLDRIDLDTSQITGNKELPRVMYVVPWKRSDLGDLTGKPANSLVDEVLQPVDRDVFNREERYYHTVAPEKSSSAAPQAAPAGH